MGIVFNEIRRQGVTLPGGKPVRGDRIMDDGFKGLFDFLSPVSLLTDVTSVPAGRHFGNVLSGGDDAVTVTGTAGVSARGLLLAGVGFVQLPDAFKMPANTTRFAFGVTIWNDPAATYPINNVSIFIAGYGYQTGPQCQYMFTTASDASGKLQALAFRSMTASVQMSQVAATALLNDGKVHFLVGEWERLSGTSFKISLYVDGALVGSTTNTTAYTGALAQPVNPNNGVTTVPALGTNTTSGAVHGYSNILRGAVGRTWIKNFTSDNDNVPVATTAAKEFAAYATRFG